MRTYVRDHGIAVRRGEVKTLDAAFEKAWHHLSVHPVSRTDDAARLRIRLAQELLRISARGERDPKRMATLAILSITAGHR
jgi:hypothetical protein